MDRLNIPRRSNNQDTTHIKQEIPTGNINNNPVINNLDNFQVILTNFKHKPHKLTKVDLVTLKSNIESISEIPQNRPIPPNSSLIPQRRLR
jgi:hypothetical protein